MQSSTESDHSHHGEVPGPFGATQNSTDLETRRVTSTKNKTATISAAAKSRQVLDQAESDHARLSARQDQATAAVDHLTTRLDQGDEKVSTAEWAGVPVTLLGLAAAFFIQVAATIARHHHERYDGLGYPDGDRYRLCARHHGRAGQPGASGAARLPHRPGNRGWSRQPRP